MSGALADEVYKRRMPDDMPSARYRDFLVVHALHANADGTESRPGNALVAIKVECGERTAKRYTRYWIDKGVLRLVRRGRSTTGRGNSQPNVYEVHLEVLPLKAQVEPQVERGATAVPSVARRSDDERERGAISDERGAIWDERRATAVPRVRTERPIERPLERPTDSEVEEEEEPNPNGQPKSAAKEESRPDAREIAAGIGEPPKPFDPTNPKQQSKRCVICGKFISWRRTVCPTHKGAELLPYLEQAASQPTSQGIFPPRADSPALPAIGTLGTAWKETPSDRRLK
jgi:hypothetical protein